MFNWNYEIVMTNIEEMKREILALDTRYSTTKYFLDSIDTVKRSVEALKIRYNTGIRVKGHWIDDENGHQYCSNCQATKIQVNDNFCGNCGADMGKL